MDETRDADAPTRVTARTTGAGRDSARPPRRDDAPPKSDPAAPRDPTTSTLPTPPTPSLTSDVTPLTEVPSDPKTPGMDTTRPSNRPPPTLPTPASIDALASASQESTSFSGSGVRGVSVLESSGDAQKQTAIDGHRVISGSMLIWCALGVPVTLLAPGSMTDKWIILAGIAVVALCYVWTFWRATRGDLLDIEDALPIATVSAIAGQAIALGAGICSPYVALVALAFTLFSTSVPRRQALVVLGVLSATHLTLGALAALGVTSSTGLLDPAPRETVSILNNVLWVELIYVTAFLIGQIAHGEAGRMMGRFESAVREAAQRDALWREVRAELDRASKLGGPGQFTGRDLGEFRLGDVLGRGGMGEVYAARRREDGLDVAVKLLRLDALSEVDVVARFEREAQLVARLRSPHVVTVYAVGGREAPVPFIAMELLRGTDLAAELRNLGVLPMRDAVTLVREVARGLAAAHEAGIVHRDLKPSNLFLADLGSGKRTWKILDFGVSKLIGDDATLTVNQLVGTPQYMAPEQAAGAKGVDHRADVHALAVIAYRALSGHSPFARSDIGQVLLAVAHEIPQDPRKTGNVSDDVAAVIRIGIAKKPDDRFASALELAAALSDAAKGDLSAELRERAARLVAAEPWGARIDR